MNHIKISISIFLALAASRFIPHPPNFTSLMALSFYVPVIFGFKFTAVLILSFILTDIFIGFHNVAFFTWGSVFFIGLISKYFTKNLTSRLSGALLGAFSFFIITNFGVWSFGSYGYSFEGLITCYYFAIPFFTYSLISTLVFSVIIEIIYKYRSLLFQFKG